MRKSRLNARSLLPRLLLLALVLRAFSPLLAQLGAPGAGGAFLLADVCSVAAASSSSPHDSSGVPVSERAAGDHCLLCGGVGMVPPTTESRFAAPPAGPVLFAQSFVFRSLPSTYGGFQFLATAPPRA